MLLNIGRQLAYTISSCFSLFRCIESKSVKRNSVISPEVDETHHLHREDDLQDFVFVLVL